MYSSTPFGLIAILVYLVIVAIAVVGLYWIIRLAVFHALRAHTQWLRGGQQ